jgi:peptidoglycan/LPS O-acetylase OafA/YrhL
VKNVNADGLRGFAALSVVLAHFCAAFVPGVLHANFPTVFAAYPAPGPLTQLAGAPFSTLFYNGHFAVLVFFVLSGYVLSMPYYSQPERAVCSLQRRLWGRYLRLNLPIIAAIALALAVFQLGGYANGPAAERSGSLLWLKTFFAADLTTLSALREAAFGSIVLGQASWLPPLWSLCIEFIGSIYLLLFFLVKPAQRTVVPMLVVFALLTLTHRAQAIFYVAIFVGAWIHEWPLAERPRLRWLGVVLGAYFGAFQYSAWTHSWLPTPPLFEIKTFYNTIGAVLLTAAVVHGTGSRLWSGALGRFLGRTSFAVYLLHFILLCSLACHAYLWLPPGMLSLALVLALYLASCYGLSVVFERYIDRPSIELSRRFANWLLAKPETRSEKQKARLGRASCGTTRRCRTIS